MQVILQIRFLNLLINMYRIKLYRLGSQIHYGSTITLKDYSGKRNADMTSINKQIILTILKGTSKLGIKLLEKFVNLNLKKSNI